jgi:M6 family metalloprotease-like protein
LGHNYSVVIIKTVIAITIIYCDSVIFSPSNKLAGHKMYKITSVIFLLLISQIAFCLSNDLIQGVLVHEIGDSHDDRNITVTRFYLDSNGDIVELEMSEELSSSQIIHDFINKKVAVSLKDQLLPNSKRQVQSIELLEGENRGGSVFGSQPWVSILCKFSDKTSEPRNLPFFEGMYANVFSGLDHYWREVSYNKIDIIGSIAIDWVDLPGTQVSYIPTPGSNSDANLSKLFDDCTAAADPFVDFSDIGDGNTSFVGINMMFNDNLDCCAWGGGRGATLDGLNKFWRVTWEPPWSYANEAIIAHEMGHGFGLPHANNSDEDSNSYDSPWGVMSSPTGNSVTHNVYGSLGKHINMYHKSRLNWVTDSDGYIADLFSNETITIDRSALLQTSNYRFARIPLSDSTFYIIETRFKISSYENNLPGTAVIIHHVDQNRSSPSWIVDADIPPADFSNNEGSMWKVGESFVDPIDGYTVTVIESTEDGFRVQIEGSLNDLMFTNGFE